MKACELQSVVAGEFAYIGEEEQLMRNRAIDLAVASLLAFAPTLAVADDVLGEKITATVSLEGDDKRPRILDLEPNRTRVFKEMAGDAVVRTERDGDEIETNKTYIAEVRVGKKLDRKKKEALFVGATFSTEAIRQRIRVEFTLTGAGKKAWSYEERVVLGLTGGDIAMGGAFAAAAAEKSKPVEMVIPLTDELRAALATEATLEVQMQMVD
jgi:hypothetical protein